MSVCCSSRFWANTLDSLHVSAVTGQDSSILFLFLFFIFIFIFYFAFFLFSLFSVWFSFLFCVVSFFFEPTSEFIAFGVIAFLL